MSRKEKQVLIPQSLFGLLIKYFLLDDPSDHDQIKTVLETKFNQMLKHQYYSDYKQEKDPIKQEEARIHYLEQAGIPESFRW